MTYLNHCDVYLNKLVLIKLMLMIIYLAWHFSQKLVN